jgi:hypothetical protein
MGNRPPNMVPGGAGPVVAQRSEDVRAVREASPRGPGPPALERFPGGYAFRNGRAGYRRVAKRWGGGCGSIAFPATPLARGRRAGSGRTAHLLELTLLRRPKSCERRGRRVPVILPYGRPNGQAGGVPRLCLPEPDVPPSLSCDRR